MKRHSLFWVFAISTLLLDQAVKEWTRQQFHIGQARPIWPGVFELTLTYNKGIAFGMAQGMGVWLAPVAIAISVGAGMYSFRHPKESVVAHMAMGLLASGAIGNLIDRVLFGKVTDMFWFRLIDFPVFNVADTCITFATIFLMVIWWRDSADQKSPATAPVEEPATPAEPQNS